MNATILHWNMSHLNLSNSIVKLNVSTLNQTSAKHQFTAAETISLICFIFIFILGTFGNGLVMFYFGYKRRLKRSIPEMLFYYLAFVDFLTSIYSPILYTYYIFNQYQWHFGLVACKIFAPLGAVFTAISGGIFVIIAIDRQRTIVHPFKSHFKRSVINMCVLGVVVYSLVVNMYYSVSVEVTDRKLFSIRDVRKKSYSVPTIVAFLMQDCFLIFVFAFTNFRIFSYLCEKSVSEIFGRFTQRRKKETTKVIRLLITLATVYFILILPRDVFHLIHIISWMDDDGIKMSPLIFRINTTFKLLHTANSCVNTFIYYKMHPGFKRCLVNVICCRKDGNRFNREYVRSTMFTESDLTPQFLRRLFKRENSTSMIEGDQKLLENSTNGPLNPNSPNRKLSSSYSPKYLTPTADRKSVPFSQSNRNERQEPNK